MEGQVVIKPKGNILDSEQYKIMLAIEGIDDNTERFKRDAQLSGDAIKRIIVKILDAIYISEMDLPFYIMALECLTELFKEAIGDMGDIKEDMEVRLEMLRRVRI